MENRLSGILFFFSDLEGAELTMAVNRPTETEYEKKIIFFCQVQRSLQALFV